MDRQKRETQTCLKHQEIRDAYFALQGTPRLPKDSSNKQLREEIAERFHCTSGHVYRCLREDLPCRKRRRKKN